MKMSTKEVMAAQLFALREGEHVEWVRLVGAIADLHERIKVFEAMVWFPRLQSMVNSTDIRGMTGTLRGIKVMTWCCAGRCLIQLERGDDRITLITLITADDEEPWQRENAHVAPGMGPMGLQGIEADHVEAMKLLYEATRYGSDICLSPDPEVSIG